MLTILAAAIFGSAAHAQSAQESALARTLFEEGVRLGDAGDWAGAADRFERAHGLKPTPGLAFNWASALIHTGKLVEASELLQKVSRDPAASPELRRESEAKLADLAPRIPYLTLRLALDPGPAARIEVNGAEWPRAAWGVASPIDPGAYQVICTNEARELARADVSLLEGERRALTLQWNTEPAPAAPLPQPDTAPQEKRPLYKNWMLWAGVGAAVAAGVVVAVIVGTGDPKTEAPAKTTSGVIEW